MTSSYAWIRIENDIWFKRMFVKVLPLAQVVGSTETFPRIYSRQRHRNNLLAESAFEYWKCTVVIPFLDIVCEEICSRFGPEKRAHYDLCAGKNYSEHSHKQLRASMSHFYWPSMRAIYFSRISEKCSKFWQYCP